MVRRVGLGVLAIVGCAGGVGNDGSGASGVGGSSSDTDAAITVASVTPADTTDGTETTAPSATVDPSMTTDDPSGDTTTAGDCTTHWRTPHAGPISDVAFDEAGGIVYAVGVSADATTGWALALDACDGTVLADTSIAHVGANTTRLDAVLVDAAGVYVTGSVTLADEPQEGYHALLDPTDLQPAWSHSLYGSMARDEVLDATLTSGGNLWMSGTAGFDTMSTAWIVAGTPSGEACGFVWSGLGSGSARAIAAMGDQVVVAIVDAQAQLVLARYDGACTCMCEPDAATMPMFVGTGNTAVGDLAIIDDQVYVAGWRSAAGAPDVLDAFVAWFSPTGVLVDVYAPSLSNGSGFFFAGGDSDRLVLGGVEGYDIDAGVFTSASAVLQAIDLPLGADAAAAWSVRPADLDTVVGVGQGADGMLYVAGMVDDAGVVLRCDMDGNCG